jgi:hypothetical protein
MTYRMLRLRASEVKLPGRSRMTKQELYASLYGTDSPYREKVLKMDEAQSKWIEEAYRGV